MWSGSLGMLEVVSHEDAGEGERGRSGAPVIMREVSAGYRSERRGRKHAVEELEERDSFGVVHRQRLLSARGSTVSMYAWWW